MRLHPAFLSGPRRASGDREGAGRGGVEPHPSRTAYPMERSTPAFGRHDPPTDGVAAAEEVGDENDVWRRAVNTTLTTVRLQAQSIEDAFKNHPDHVDSSWQQCEQRVKALEAGDLEERLLAIDGVVRELVRMGEAMDGGGELAHRSQRECVADATNTQNRLIKRISATPDAGQAPRVHSTTFRTKLPGVFSE